MARKKPAKKAVKKAKPVRRAAKKGGGRKANQPKAAAKKAKPVRRAAKKGGGRKAAPKKVAAKAKPVRRAAKKGGGRKANQPKIAARKPAAIKSAPVKAAPKAAAKKPNLDRPRKTVADVHGIPSSLDMNRAPSAAKSGRADMRDRLSKVTGSGPALTGGDIDADWQSAESIGDEAPGGDNPTPDQDVVDDIGRSLGVEYADDEELQGGAEISERDHHRWELDPSSKDDFDDEE